MRRLQALPGFGKQKAQIFTALLGKQLGVRPEGWQAAAGVRRAGLRTGPSPTSSTRRRWTRYAPSRSKPKAAARAG